MSHDFENICTRKLYEIKRDTYQKILESDSGSKETLEKYYKNLNKVLASRVDDDDMSKYVIK